MQQLFPAEGETVPRLRFPEFRDAGEWEVKQLGEMCDSFSGGTPKTTRKDYYGGIIPFIRSAEIGEKSTELFLTKKGLKSSAAKMVSKGDVAISKIDGAINQAILCLRTTGPNRFIYHSLAYKKEQIISTYIQGGQGNLSGDIVLSLKIRCPQPSEQQKIADCLSSLDELIELQSQKIEALKQHKKGLMQQLFPQEVV
ncbi:MAG TPA: restriction endonuclease subunit S [Desulfobulbus sp.]|nr:restriction endonuclease subunit S [Desulfobulbus sp.]